MNLDLLKSSLAPLGTGTAAFVVAPWWAAVALVVFFHGSRPARDWVDTARYLHRRPGVGEGAGAHDPGRPTPADLAGSSVRPLLDTPAAPGEEREAA